MRHLRPEPEVHPLHVRVPERHVAERVEVEVGPELAVEHGERIGHEGRGHPVGVVVGRDQPVGALDQVGAEQQPVAGLEGVGQRAQEGATLLDIEVADRAAQEGHQASVAGWKVAQVQGEVADHGLDRDVGVAGAEQVGGVAQRGLRDVDRHEPAQPPGRVERVEQQPGLVAGAAAELDEGGGVTGRGDVGGVLGEDRPLSLGRVVLLEPSDLVEQPRPLVVVEPFRGQPQRLPTEPPSDVVDEAAGRPVGVEEYGDLGGGSSHDGAPPSARRTPERGHLALCG